MERDHGRRNCRLAAELPGRLPSLLQADILRAYYDRASGEFVIGAELE